MMLLPIMINDDVIGHIYARRLEPLSPGRKTYHYDWSVDVDPVHREGGGLEHVRNDGVLELVKKILERATLSL